MLQAAATSYFDGEHYGFIIAGEFERGPHRGGGRYVNSFARDRIRALQLMSRAMTVIPADTPKPAQSQFYFEFARMMLGYRSYREAWRLQYLSDLTTLPDYEEGYGYYGGTQGAPVLPDGTPVYYPVPKSYTAAGNDGERWRWMLNQAVNVNPEENNRVT